MSLSIPGLTSLPPGLDRPAAPQRGGRPAESANLRLGPRPEGGAAAEAVGHRASIDDVPPGTDPELWAVLTTEERAHFSRLRSMGPLTYTTTSGASSSAPPQGRRGVRLDVRA